jgi:hypothetical protein
MAASPVALTPAPVSNHSYTRRPPLAYSRRPPLALTPRRLAANRRNAARSTGPRTPNGKARVARNAITHGFFAGAERWTEQQQRDFAETFAGLCEDFNPQCAEEEICVATLADCSVRMAALLRFENLAALRYHQQCERELNERIAAAERSEAARLENQRDQLRRAGLWKPTIPGPREAMAIVRYQGRLDRAIRGATAELEGFRSHRKAQEQTHFVQQNRGISANAGIAADAIGRRRETFSASPCPDAPMTSKDTTLIRENTKTNPLSSMFTGNRHARRRAEALARRRT